MANPASRRTIRPNRPIVPGRPVDVAFGGTDPDIEDLYKLLADLKAGAAQIGTVDIPAGGFSADDVLVFVGGQWVGLAKTVLLELTDLSDVVVTSPVTDHVLTYQSGQWVNAPITEFLALGDLSDVTISAGAEGDFIVLNALGEWENRQWTPGVFGVGVSPTLSQVEILVPDAGTRALVTRGVTAQTAAHYQARDVSSNVLFEVAADGVATAPSIQFTTDGSAATPAASWASDPNTGMYRVSADALGFACGGGTPMSLTTAQVNMNRPMVLANAATTELLFSGDLQTDIKSDDTIVIDFDRDADGGGANFLEIRAGGVTRFKIHDTPLVVQQGGDSDTPSSYQYKAADALTAAVGSALQIKPGQSAGTDQDGAALELSGGQCTGSGASGPLILSAAASGASGTTVRSLVERARIDSAGLTIADGHAIIAGSTSGLTIGTVGGAAGQKIGAFGATPVVQPLLATGAGATVDNVITALQALGWVRQS